MQISSKSIFVSDIHLTQNNELIKNSFFSFLDNFPEEVNNLFIVGDLFDLWIGDDVRNELVEDLHLKLRKITNNKKNIFFFHGNRDFLVGESFCKTSNIKLISEPTVFEFFGYKTLILHGDQLCTEDVDYQNFCKIVRNEQWQSEFLSLSIPERLKIAQNVRKESSVSLANKDDYITDVADRTVLKYFEKYRVTHMIHGHTHRPKIHLVENNFSRLVIPDWNNNYWGYISSSQNGFAHNLIKYT
ncbi:MAG: UDP-2,3-diacylglucosamine diphosphatase [Hydrogenophilales bacterium]